MNEIFKAFWGWFQRFKVRAYLNGFKYEAASADITAAEHYPLLLKAFN